MTIIFEGNNLAIMDISIERASQSDYMQLDELIGKDFWIHRIEEHEVHERYFLMRDYKAYSQKLEDEVNAEKEKRLEEAEVNEFKKTEDARTHCGMTDLKERLSRPALTDNSQQDSQS